MDANTNQHKLTVEEQGILLQMTAPGTDIGNMPRQHQEDLIEAYHRGILDPADEPATYKQERFMRRFGLWDDRQWYSKEDASRIIGEYLAKERFELHWNRVP